MPDWMRNGRVVSRAPYTGKAEATYCLTRFVDQALSPDIGIIWSSQDAGTLVRAPVPDANGYGFAVTIEWQAAAPNRPPRGRKTRLVVQISSSAGSKGNMAARCRPAARMRRRSLPIRTGRNQDRAKDLAHDVQVAHDRSFRLSRKLYLALLGDLPATFVGTPVAEAYFNQDNPDFWSRQASWVGRLLMPSGRSGGSAPRGNFSAKIGACRRVPAGR